MRGDELSHEIDSMVGNSCYRCHMRCTDHDRATGCHARTTLCRDAQGPGHRARLHRASRPMRLRHKLQGRLLIHGRALNRQVLPPHAQRPPQPCLRVHTNSPNHIALHCMEPMQFVVHLCAHACSCGYDQQGEKEELEVDGILGIGRGTGDLVSQLKQQGLITENVVGHCLSSHGGGYLFFGGDVPSTGVTWLPMVQEYT